MIYQSINLDINPGGFPAIVRISQYDTLVGVIATILRDGQVMVLPAGTTATIEGTKPSTLGFSEAGTVDEANGTVTFDIAATMSEEAGDIPCEIVLTNSGQRVGTANFVLAIEASPHPEGTLDGDAESAQTLVEQMQAAVHDAETAAASVMPVVVTVADSEPVIVADAQKVYKCTVPVTAMDLTPDATGITEVFFESASSGCTLTLPASVLIPPGITVTTSGSDQTLDLPTGFKYELSIFEDHLLMEAWNA